MSNKKTILVTGATGQQGGAIARELLAKDYHIKAMTRNTHSEKAQTLAKLGAELVQADLDDAATLRKVIKDAWGVYAVQNTWEAGVENEEIQGKRIAKIAKEAGVQHYVYSSVGSAHRNTGIPHFDNKWRIEETIRGLGIPSYTIIRPVFFMDNLISPWFKPGIDDGKLYVGIKPETALQMIAVGDIGRYGCWAFENHEQLNGREIDIAGDALTMPEAARIISSVAGKTVEFVQVPIEEVRKFSEDFALMYEWFDRVGYEADIEGISQRSGIQPTSFAEWAKKINW
ncbi:MAG: NmrA/HSCARG family protein [Candidatus Latescibacteria bacterium]|nr:NmrA/HSCARG family protein [Candidatus Latescibacterota bacterium]